MSKLFTLLFLFFALPFAFGEKSDFVVLPQGEVHKGDLFISGGTVEINGEVEGDLYAFGSRVSVNGTIQGDVIASGGTLEIAGRVAGNARLGGAQIELRGTIERNVTAVGGNIQSSHLSLIKGNAVLTGGIIDLAGTILGNATLTASNGRLLGKIGNNLKAYVGQLRLGSQSAIGGNLEYTSNNEVIIDSGAQIGGKTLFTTSTLGTVLEGKWKRGLIFGSKVTGILMSFLFSFVIGWILLRFFPVKVKTTLTMLEKRPWKSFGIGLLILVLFPIAALILFITILGIPLAFALVTLGLLTFYTAKIFPILWVSNRLFPHIGVKPSSLFILFLGLVLYFLVIQIPFIGGLLSFAVILFGLGALILSRAHKHRKRAR